MKSYDKKIFEYSVTYWVENLIIFVLHLSKSFYIWNFNAMGSCFNSYIDKHLKKARIRNCPVVHQIAMNFSKTIKKFKNSL